MRRDNDEPGWQWNTFSRAAWVVLLASAGVLTGASFGWSQLSPGGLAPLPAPMPGATIPPAATAPGVTGGATTPLVTTPRSTGGSTLTPPVGTTPAAPFTTAPLTTAPLSTAPFESTIDPYAPALHDPLDPFGNPCATGMCPPDFCRAPLRRKWPRFRLFADLIYWRASEVSTSYALPITPNPGPVIAPIMPAGPVASLEPEYDPGFRVGFGYSPAPMSEFAVMYTSFDSENGSSVSVTAPTGLAALVLMPGTAGANTIFQTAAATGDLDLDLGDLEYRRTYEACWFRGDALIGARYASLDQNFNASFGPSTTAPFTDTLATSVDFEGAGIKVGLEGEWQSPTTGFLIYAKGHSSFLAGDVTAAYVQQQNGTTVVTTSFSDQRVVTILDLDVGLGWRSPNRRFYLSVGYMFSGWFNAMTTDAWITAVQNTAYGDVNDSLSFDGLTARAELRF